MNTSVTLWCLLFVDNVFGENDIRVALVARLKWNGVNAKVFNQIEYRLEPQVFHAALAVRVDAHPEMLRLALVVECQHEFANSSFALPNQKHAVP